jgi:hypothetical protein
LKGCSTRLAESYFAELLYVGASYKRATSADDYDGDNAVVFLELLNGLRNALGHAGLSALTGGLLMVMTAMSLSLVTWTSWFIYRSFFME